MEESAAKSLPPLGDAWVPGEEEPEPLARRISDYLLVKGPTKPHDLFGPLYAFLNPGNRARAKDLSVADRDKKITMTDINADQRAYLKSQIRLGIEKGWLAELPDGTIDIGQVRIPEHRDLEGLARGDDRTRAEVVAQSIFSADNRRAREFLKIARQKPDPKKRELLKESIQKHGLNDPIKRWNEVNQSPVIVDGQTRLEICKELGIEPVFIDLETIYPKLTPLQILEKRINYELEIASTKAQQGRLRESYIKNLVDAGFTQSAIAETLAITEKAVSMTMSRMKLRSKSRLVPSDVDIDEMWELFLKGGKVRDIAETTGWSRMTVHKFLAARRESLSATPTPCWDDGQNESPQQASKARSGKTRTKIKPPKMEATAYDQAIYDDFERGMSQEAIRAKHNLDTRAQVSSACDRVKKINALKSATQVAATSGVVADKVQAILASQSVESEPVATVVEQALMSVASFVSHMTNEQFDDFVLGLRKYRDSGVIQ